MTDPSAGPDAARQSASRGRQARSAGASQKVENRIGRMEVGTAYFGFGGERLDARDSSTGLISEDAIKEALTCFVQPESFEGALSTLVKKYAVILEGSAGSGRRTGALSLLDRVVPGPVQRIQPGVTLDELHTWDFEPDQAYVVIDHVSQEAGSSSEYSWDSLCEALRSKGDARLVITRNGPVKYAETVLWQRPEAAVLMRSRLDGAEIPAETIAAVLNQLPKHWTVPDLVECCRRLRAEPEAVASAVSVFNVNAAKEVMEWFDAGRSRREIVEVTTLSFATGLGERQFEGLADRFEAVLEKHLPTPEPASGERASPVTDPLSRRRRARHDGPEGLILRTRVLSGVVPRYEPQFKSEYHWRAVLAELHAGYDLTFWNAVNEWSGQVLKAAERPEEITAFAIGLAGLAAVDVEETMAILDLFTSSQSATVSGVNCAALTLSLMASDDDLAPIALRIAIAWLNQRNLSRKLAAGQALVADLGLRYPAEAARRLWQLIAQDDDLSDTAIDAPAFLFANLVLNGRDADDVLAMVNEKVQRFNNPRWPQRDAGSFRLDNRMVHLSLDMALGLLEVSEVEESDTAPPAEAGKAAVAAGDPARSKKVERSSVFRYLESKPEGADVVAQIWVTLLRNRRYRLDGLEALWAGLRGCSDRERLGPVLGSAVQDHFWLPRADHEPSEQALFVADLRSFDLRKRRRPDAKVESYAQEIITFLEMNLRRTNGKAGKP
jgi:hypothetical protein